MTALGEERDQRNDPERAPGCVVESKAVPEWDRWSQVSFGKLIFELERVRREYYERTLAEYGLRAADLPVLALLWEGHDGDTMATIASDIGFDPATVTRVVRHLEAGGYVRREQSQRDTRAWRVLLTDRGKELAVPVNAIAKRFSDTLTIGMTPEQRTQCMAHLRDMLDNASVAFRD